MSEQTNFRKKQTERGNEAVHLFGKFLEGLFGELNISIHEQGYSVGAFGCPDIVFREYGIEVKRVELLTKRHYRKTEDYNACQNCLKVNSFEWDLQKTWCRKNKKTHVLVVVFTWGRADPIYLGFTEQQINVFREDCKNRPSYKRENESTDYHNAFWFGKSSFELLRVGTVLNNEVALCKFFDAIPENSA
jgi:hypothetical protein